MAILVGQEPAIDKFIQNGLGDFRAGERIVEGATVAIAGRRKQFVLDKVSHADRKILQCADVEVLENFLLLDVEKVRGDFRVRPAPEPTLIELLQHQAQQGWSYSD